MVYWSIRIAAIALWVQGFARPPGSRPLSRQERRKNGNEKNGEIGSFRVMKKATRYTIVMAT